jgi:hypothetical protein
MKKIAMIFSAVAMMTASASAQELKSKKGENFLPEKGDWSIGFNADGIFSYIGNAFNGTAGNEAPTLDYQKLGTFVGKRFTSDKTADRYMANLGFNSDKTGDNTASGFDLTLGYGKEWRKGKTRLQGFYGADAMINVNSSSTKTVVGATTTTVKSGLGFGVGAQGFIGAEYFIFPKISMGAQYTYGLMLGVDGKSTTSVTGSPDVEGPASTNFNLGGVGVMSINVNLHF